MKGQARSRGQNATPDHRQPRTQKCHFTVHVGACARPRHRTAKASLDPRRAPKHPRVDPPGQAPRPADGGLGQNTLPGPTGSWSRGRDSTSTIGKHPRTPCKVTRTAGLWPLCHGGVEPCSGHGWVIQSAHARLSSASSKFRPINTRADVAGGSPAPCRTSSHWYTP